MYDVIPFSALSVGDRASVSKTVTEADGALYIAATGDFGPVHIDERYAQATRFGRRLAPGIMVAGLCTSVLTAELAGVLGVSIEDRFWFTGPVFYGDTITIAVWIAEKDEATRTLTWDRPRPRTEAGTRGAQGPRHAQVPAGRSPPSPIPAGATLMLKKPPTCRGPHGRDRAAVLTRPARSIGTGSTAVFDYAPVPTPVSGFLCVFVQRPCGRGTLPPCPRRSASAVIRGSRARHRQAKAAASPA